MTLSTAEVNYLAAIHKLSRGGNRVSTNALAGEFSIAPASVTDMVQKLADKNLVEYIPYKGVSLSPSAVPIAEQSNQNHQLWSEFLTDKLGIADTTTSSLVNEFQEIRSEIVLNRLKSFLEQEEGVKTIVREVIKEVEVPVEVVVEKEVVKEIIKEVEVPVEVIVEKEVEVIKEVEKVISPQPDLFSQSENTTVATTYKNVTTLSDARFGRPLKIIGLQSVEGDILSLVKRYQLEIGTEIQLVTQYDFDDSFLVTEGEREFVLSKQLAAFLLVTVTNK